MTAIHPRRTPKLRWPSTTSGRRAIRLWSAAVLAVILALLVTLASGGVYQEAGEDPAPVWARALSAILGIAAIGGAIAGGVFAIVALRRGDRSAVLFLPVLALLLAAFFIVGEFIPPGH